LCIGEGQLWGGRSDCEWYVSAFGAKFRFEKANKSSKGADDGCTRGLEEGNACRGGRGVDIVEVVELDPRTTAG
jgi:hypothetical protein